MHSFTFTHVVPLKVYPALHEHEYAPLVFEQVPAPQIPGVFVHSLTSTQVAESPLPLA